MPSDAILEHHFFKFFLRVGIPPDPQVRACYACSERFSISNSTKLSPTEMFKPYHFKTASYGPVPVTRH